MIQFEAWPKTQRLSNTTIAITEKIDGTNAAVVITPITQAEYDEDFLTWELDDFDPSTGARVVPSHWLHMTQGSREDELYVISAQSRKRLIWPGSDNYGFAAWVKQNAVELVDLLGPGRHFGEWWGQGIQRGYGMDRKVFSLFNQHRWSGVAEQREDWRPRARDINMTTVPLLYAGKLDLRKIENSLNLLRKTGSYASPEWGSFFDRPEGVVTYFPYLDVRLKSFVENDDIPKGEA